MRAPCLSITVLATLFTAAFSSYVEAQSQCSLADMQTINQLYSAANAYGDQWFSANDSTERCGLDQEQLQQMQQIESMQSYCDPIAAIRTRGAIRRAMATMSSDCNDTGDSEDSPFR